MTWTSPFSATVGGTITAAGHNTSIRDNLNHLRALLPDAGAANYWLQSSATTTAAFVARVTALSAAIAELTSLIIPCNTSVTGTLTASGNVSSSGGGGVFPGGVVCASAGGTFAGAVSGTQLQSSIATGTAPLTVSSTTVVTNLNADTVDGSHASAFALAAAGVPSGLIAMVTNAAAIPSGWSRESGLNGRVPVGDDLGVTFTSENNYGSATHTHTAAALGISGNTGAPSATDGLGNGGGTTTPTATHTHNQGTLDVTGTTDATSNLPLARAYVFVKRD